MAKNWRRSLGNLVSENRKETLHGGGIRYNEKNDGSNSLIKECAKYLPENAANPMDISVSHSKYFKYNLVTQIGMNFGSFYNKSSTMFGKCKYSQ
jgi:hypothetical protein